ncbi:hypothetical protein [Marinobacter sp.]|uniref:hypothetical protein n=1 Tax=Marinobacter sp. TaxID=50741 RepID=UPI00356A2687
MNQRVVCVEPEVAVDFAEFRPLLEKVLDLIRRSIQIHGDWSDYDEDRVFDAVAGEFDEYREAVVVRDVSGRHG